MAAKRGCDDGDQSGGYGHGGPSKRRLAFSDAVLEVMEGASANEIVRMIEPMMRRAVREEVECIVQTLHQSRPSNNRIETSITRGFKLRFESKIPHTIFTGSRIENETNSIIKVVLIDANSNNIVSSGPMSNAKIEIVVLDSDFGSDDQEDWLEEAFANNILCEREGRRPLVTGELTVTLRHGVGHITDVSFTDNSSWTRSRKFKLGGRVVGRVSGGIRVREAVSEPFMVKDHRGESYKKNHPPHLLDDVWRLERIGKDGAFHKRLVKCGIKNLMEFLQIYHIDSLKLRRILGGGISDKKWDTIIEHAKECVVDDDKLHVYCGEGAWIAFDSTFKPVAATFDGQNYLSLDALDFSQDRLVQEVKRQAYKNVNQFVAVDKASICVIGRPVTSLHTEPLAALNLETQMGFNEAGNFTPRSTLKLPMTPMFPSTRSIAWSPSHNNTVETTWSPNVVTWGQGGDPGIEFLSSLPNLGVHISRTRSIAWCKIRAAIKWQISFKQAKKLRAFLGNRTTSLLH